MDKSNLARDADFVIVTRRRYGLAIFALLVFALVDVAAVLVMLFKM